MIRFSKEIEKYTFNGCATCKECCDGKRFVLAPLILEDFKVVVGFFPILFGYIDNELKVFMLFGNGEETCPYLVNDFCSIYTTRPPACRTYPLTPYDGTILCDTTCPAVEKVEIAPKGIKFKEDKNVNPIFYTKRFEGFKEKLEKTTKWLKEVEKHLIPMGHSVKTIDLFRLPIGYRKDIYVDTHINSLSKLNIFKEPIKDDLMNKEMRKYN